MITHKDTWNAIERLATDYELSCSGLARKGGLNPTTFNKSKRIFSTGQERWPSLYSISKILNALNLTMQDFSKYFPDKKHTAQ